MYSFTKQSRKCFKESYLVRDSTYVHRKFISGIIVLLFYFFYAATFTMVYFFLFLFFLFMIFFLLLINFTQRQLEHLFSFIQIFIKKTHTRTRFHACVQRVMTFKNASLGPHKLLTASWNTIGLYAYMLNYIYFYTTANYPVLSSW